MTGTAAVQPRRHGSTAAVRPEDAAGGTSPRTGQRVVNLDTGPADRRGWWSTHRGGTQEDGQQCSAEGAQESPRDAGCPTQ